MSIYLDSKADLAAMFSVKAGIIVPVSDLVFGTPVATTAAEKTLYGKNTKVGVKFTDSSTLGMGGTKVFYDRLDVTPLGLANFRGIAVTGGQNLAAMLPVLKNLSGATFTSDDLVEHSTVDDGDGGITFLIESKPDSLGWFGSVTVAFNVALDIETAFSGDTLPGF